MNHQEFLLSYGSTGDFGRFAAAEALACRRGDKLVVRSPRGQEVGVVLCPSTPGHAQAMSDAFLGQILRPATAGDLELDARMQRRSQALFKDARRLQADLELPLEVLDAEILLDGRHAILHHLRWADCDPRPLMDCLARDYSLLVSLHDLALPAAAEEQDGCTRADCGGGGCGSCSSGGCSSCGNVAAKAPAPTAPDTPAEDSKRLALL